MDRLVSVIISTLGRPELKRAVASVKNQTYKPVELIIIDDKTLSPTQARNKGIKESKGDFIAFLDDDDEWLPTKLEKQVKMFDLNPLLVICWIDDRRFKKHYIDKYPLFNSLNDVLSKFRYSSTSSYIFDGNWLRNNLFDEIPSAQEYDLAIQATSQGVVSICVQETLVVQYSSKGQITKDWKKKKQGLKKLLCKHKTLYKSMGIWKYGKVKIKYYIVMFLFTLAQVVGERIYSIIIPIKKVT